MNPGGACRRQGLRPVPMYKDRDKAIVKHHKEVDMNEKTMTEEQRRMSERRDVTCQVLLTRAEFERLMRYAGRGNAAKLIRHRLADVIGADGGGHEG